MRFKTCVGYCKHKLQRCTTYKTRMPCLSRRTRSSACTSRSCQSNIIANLQANMQASNHQAYLTQRTDPKVIVPRDNHAYGAEITLTHAPMSHPSVQAYLRDAQYTSIGEAKEMLERSFQLRARLRENKETARIPLKESALTQYQERPYQSYADMFDTAPSQYQGGGLFRDI